MRRLKEKTKMFDFKTIHVPARNHAKPDALSRNPMGDMNTKEARLAVLAGIRVGDEVIEEEDLAMELVGTSQVAMCVPCLPATGHRVVVEAVTWERVKQAVTMDPTMQELRRLY